MPDDEITRAAGDGRGALKGEVELLEVVSGLRCQPPTTATKDLRASTERCSFSGDIRQIDERLNKVPFKAGVDIPVKRGRLGCGGRWRSEQQSVHGDAEFWGPPEFREDLIQAGVLADIPEGLSVVHRNYARVTGWQGLPGFSVVQVEAPLPMYKLEDIVGDALGQDLLNEDVPKTVEVTAMVV